RRHAPGLARHRLPGRRRVRAARRGAQGATGRDVDRTAAAALIVPRPVRQAGAIVFRGGGDRASVLLVRSEKEPTNWVLPKGHIEDGETAEGPAAGQARG